MTATATGTAMAVSNRKLLRMTLAIVVLKALPVFAVLTRTVVWKMKSLLGLVPPKPPGLSHLQHTAMFAVGQIFRRTSVAFLARANARLAAMRLSGVRCVLLLSLLLLLLLLC